MTQRGKMSLLLFFFCICATAALLHYQEQLQPEPPCPTELFDVVQLQLKAFRSKDLFCAYSQASSTFQQHWSLDQFSEMIQADYARILKADSIEFGPWQQRGRRAMVEVFFIDRQGNVSPCIYSLISEGESWKIEGARWVKGWPAGQRMHGIRS